MAIQRFSTDNRLLQAITSTSFTDKKGKIAFPMANGRVRDGFPYEHEVTYRERSVSQCSILSAMSADSCFSGITDASDETAATDPASTFTPLTDPHLPSKPPLKIVLGTASFGSSKAPQARFHTPEAAASLLDAFASRGYADLDTARAYPVGRGGTSERLLGQCESVHTWSNISTKVSSFMPGAHRPQNIRRSIAQSLESLQAPYGVDVMYLHAPDRATPFAETLQAMNEAHSEGAFQRLGLSNYSAEDVEQIVRICEQQGFVKPSVYQGQYNPLCRSAELGLLEVLRRHNISFYAYSPTACGFFSGKVSRDSALVKGSRWDKSSPLGQKYSQDYFHDELFKSSELVIEEAERHGISGHAAALRWTVYHSALEPALGDACILGASTVQQMEENLDILEHGPLPVSLVRVLNLVWNRATTAGPKYHF